MQGAVLLNDIHKVLAFRIFKCGNKSLKLLLPNNPVKGNPYTWNDLEGIKEIVGSKYDKYFKFTLVRNPYSRIVSCWADRTQYKDDRMYSKAYKKDFSYFVECLTNNDFGLNGSHHRPQHTFIPPLQELDYVVYLERVKEQWPEVCKGISEKSNIVCQVPLPWVNRRKDKGSIDKDYRHYYNNRLEELVYNYYRDDFKLLNYSDKL